MSAATTAQLSKLVPFTHTLELVVRIGLMDLKCDETDINFLVQYDYDAAQREITYGPAEHCQPGYPSQMTLTHIVTAKPVTLTTFGATITLPAYFDCLDILTPVQIEQIEESLSDELEEA